MKKTINFIFKKIKLRTLIVLILLLMFNTYAWFIYSTKVSGSFTTHITSWNLEFRAGDEVITTNVPFTVDRIYPGMEPYTDTVTVKNKGEMSATLKYKINSITILGDTITTGDTITITSGNIATMKIRFNDSTIKIDDEVTITSEYIEYIIANEYPFSITISVDNTDLQAETGEGQFEISLKWLFESENNEIIDGMNADERDTFWGEKAYTYYSVNPEEASIYMNIDITASQDNP